MPTNYLRRTVLAAAGVVLSGTASATERSDDDGQSQSQSQSTNVNVSQEQRVIIKNEGHQIKPGQCATCKTKEGETKEIGTLVVYNHGHCQRKVTVQVTGKIALRDERLENPTLSIQVPPKEQRTAGFTGSIVGMDAEDGDLNMTIVQRSEYLADYCGGEDRTFHNDP